jgi:hypothetical protein
MEIEHPALAGIVSASNDAESDDCRSTAATGLPGDGAVGVEPRPHVMATEAATMTKYLRTLDQLEGHSELILRGAGPSPKDHYGRTL